MTKNEFFLCTIDKNIFYPRYDVRKHQRDVLAVVKELNHLDSPECRCPESKMDERTRIMLDVIPLACTLWDASFAIIDCNQEAIHLFGLSDRQEFFDRFFVSIP
jgi:hypothetical protein